MSCYRFPVRVFPSVEVGSGTDPNGNKLSVFFPVIFVLDQDQKEVARFAPSKEEIERGRVSVGDLTDQARDFADKMNEQFAKVDRAFRDKLAESADLRPRTP